MTCFLARFGEGTLRRRPLRLLGAAPPAHPNQGLDQPPNAILAPRRRRRPSPRGGWAGSTFVKMVETVGIEPAQRSRHEERLSDPPSPAW